MNEINDVDDTNIDDLQEIDEIEFRASQTISARVRKRARSEETSEDEG